MVDHGGDLDPGHTEMKEAGEGFGDPTRLHVGRRGLGGGLCPRPQWHVRWHAVDADHGPLEVRREEGLCTQDGFRVEAMAFPRAVLGEVPA